MRQILVLGAGRSASSLIKYLIKYAEADNYRIVVADGNYALAKQKTDNTTVASAVELNVQEHGLRNRLIEQSDIVISMLPHSMHPLVADNCLAAGRHLLTASYIDDTMRSMADGIKNKKLLFLCEMGLDPGIDHMSAMHLIDRIHHVGGDIRSFFSHCGGLVAPESDHNPWHYKISWNSRNIVLAGKTGAVYKENGEIRKMDYKELFDPLRTVEIPKIGKYAWYPNRDSLKYLTLYGLNSIPTFIRTTLRHPDFCRGWKKVVQLNLTDESSIYDTTGMNYHTFLRLHLRQNGIDYPPDLSDTEHQLLDYLGLFGDENMDMGVCSAADVLQHAMEKTLILHPADKDMIIMQHEIIYELNDQPQKLISTLMAKGENHVDTAMAKTVGLPLGIAARLILQQKIPLTGLHIPVVQEIYQPVLELLNREGIIFHET